MRKFTLVAWLCFAELGLVRAATLEPATCSAWDDYVDSALSQMQQRLAPGASFLWIDEAPERLARVRMGETVVAPVGRQNPKKVPNGLIHDWIGAVFIPGATLDQVLRTSRDYARYKDWYQPGVVDSKPLESQGDRDRYWMLLMNRSLLLRTAFETEYDVRYSRPDAHRAYSIARSTHVHEVEDYSSSEERLLPEGTGRGIIWRLFGVTRYLERDGGVYVEFEAIGVSRDVPVSVRWFVDPLVRRVARSSLVTSLEQTEKAVTHQGEIAKNTH